MKRNTRICVIAHEMSYVSQIACSVVVDIKSEDAFLTQITKMQHRPAAKTYNTYELSTFAWVLG